MSANLVHLFITRQANAGVLDQPCLIWRDAPLLTFADLPLEVGRWKAVLTQRGVKPGDRVMAQAERCPEFIFAYLASLAAGAIFVPLNTAYTPDELAYFAQDAEPALILGDAASEPALRALGNFARLDALAAEAAAARPDLIIEQRQADEIATILYTSGTTGKPKGAMLSHQNLSSNCAALTEAWRFSSADVILHALPLFHAHGLFVALHLALWNGCATRLLPKFDPDAVIDRLPLASVFMGVPTLYTRLLASPRLTAEACANMRLFISGSAPLLAQTFQEFEARTGLKILERYGMTETAMLVSNGYEPAERIGGTVGFPLPGVAVRIRGEDGALLGPQQPGVLEVTGPNVLKGYWRKPEATAESFTSDGWFITGDIAVAAADGRITLVGRAKDLIISGGFNIYPAEIEGALNDLPGVAESAVIGAPHPDFGEAVVALVTIEPGADISAEALSSTLAAKLARFKQPKHLLIVPELPRNTMGKVLKAELRKTYARLFAAKAS
jgi:malonyl-CoA/methylmalonyl-CoA synthetase